MHGLGVVRSTHYVRYLLNIGHSIKGTDIRLQY